MDNGIGIRTIRELPATIIQSLIAPQKTGLTPPPMVPYPPVILSLMQPAVPQQFIVTPRSIASQDLSCAQLLQARSSLQTPIAIAQPVI